MRVAFVTPTFHTLAPTWRRDPQIVKLAAPQISGALYANGIEVIRQYDFEVEIFDMERRQPGRLNLRAFFDDANVDAYLQGDHAEVRAQSELILDAFEVEEADLFAFSSSSVLEIYADMHAAGSMILCLSKALKQRFPNCRTAVGGLKISPDIKHQEEYRSMLRRSQHLDYAIEGRGDGIILQLVDSIRSGVSLAEMGEKVEPIGNGLFVRGGSSREIRLSPEIAREEGIDVARGYVTVHSNSFLVNGANVADVSKVAPTSLVQIAPIPAKLGAPVGLRTPNSPPAASQGLPQQAGPTNETPEFGPQGDHERKPIFNPSIMMTPYFDPRNIERRKLTGRELMGRYHLLGTEWEPRLAQFGEDRIAILPSIFMEGCNARCAFCAYSMTKMVTRDVKEVVRSLAWMREKYDVKYFHFLNTNINGSMKYAEAFVDELIAANLGIYWSDCANLWALNPRLLEKLVKSGCIRFTYGLECPSDKMLDYVGKGITVKQAHERLKLASELGIWNHLLLITGLPTETEEDQKHFVDFLEKSRDYSNAYSISSFYLVGSSLMGAFPHRYNIEMLPNASGLLENQAFNEIGGLQWERKKRQIIEATELITNTIRRLKIDPKYWSGAIDLELLFWLYDRMGHANKADIVRCYEDAYLGAPAHPKSYQQTLKAAVQARTPAIELLSNKGIAVAEGGIEVRQEAMVVPVEAKGGATLEVELRCLTQGTKPSLTSGGNLGASASLKLAFADAVRELVAENSEFDRIIAKSGWRISDRNATNGLGGAGLRIELSGRALELMVSPVAEEAKTFLRKGSFGLSYKVPAGFIDPTTDPRVVPFLRSIGGWLLDRLVMDPRAQQSAFIDLDALREGMTALIAELEAPLAADIATEPAHKNANLGRRMRDQYSKVEMAKAAQG